MSPLDGKDVLEVSQTPLQRVQVRRWHWNDRPTVAETKSKHFVSQWGQAFDLVSTRGRL